MSKKILISWLALCLISMPVSAANHLNSRYHQPYPSSPYKGIYKGEIAAQPRPLPDFVPCKSPTFIPGPYLGGELNLSNNYNRTSSVYRALQGSLFGGYALLSNDLYLAAELFAQDGLSIQNYRNDLNANGNPIGLKTTWGFGLSILPGYILTDTLLSYLRIGAIKTHFQDVAQTATGGQAGIGIEGTVSDHWDLRAEYTYTFYQSLSGLGSPRADAFHLGVLYKFWG